MDEAKQQLDGSVLCLSCGMCCRGMLHGWVALARDEIERAPDLGIDVVDSPHGPAMTLPCARLEGNCCQIYADRPVNCAGYRCALLRRYEGGELSLDEALGVVSEAKELADRVTANVGAVDFPTLRNRWREGMPGFVSGDPTRSASEQRAFLYLAALALFLDRHVALPGEEMMGQKNA